MFVLLSAIHYVDRQKIKDPSQRRAITSVMEQLTGFDSFTPEWAWQGRSPGWLRP